MHAGAPIQDTRAAPLPLPFSPEDKAKAVGEVRHTLGTRMTDHSSCLLHDLAAQHTHGKTLNISNLPAWLVLWDKGLMLERCAQPCKVSQRWACDNLMLPHTVCVATVGTCMPMQLLQQHATTFY